MSTASVNNQISVLGKSILQRRTITADGNVTKDPTLAVAKVGELTTFTDSNTGTVTMVAGHGFITGNRVDLYWAGGHRYGMTVTVTVNSVVFDGGTGDNLPVVNTAVTAMKPQLENFAVNTADLAALFVSCGAQAMAVFLDDTDTEVKAIYVESATDSFVWDSEQVTDIEATNPFSLGDVVTVYLSHGDSSATRQVNAVALVN